MTSSNPMTREELIEQAALDAFGLLDDYEQSLFTRSFHHAPTGVQEEILQLQAEIASDEALLPEVEPPAELRAKVLRAVARAIEAEAATLGPLASIGRRRAAAERGAARSPLITGGQFWRAAAFALMGTVIVVSYFLAEASRKNHEIATIAINSNTSTVLEQMIGPTVKDFLFDPAQQKIVLHPVAPGAPLRAAILLKEHEGEGFLVFDGLPRSNDRGYTLAILGDDGQTRQVLATFDSNGQTGGAKIENLPMQLLSSGVLQVLKTATSEVLMTSA